MINSASNVDFTNLANSSDKPTLLLLPHDMKRPTTSSSQSQSQSASSAKVPQHYDSCFYTPADWLNGTVGATVASAVATVTSCGAPARRERVMVQHLETHNVLQNNRWNLQTLYNAGADTKTHSNANINTNTNNNNNNNKNNNNNNNTSSSNNNNNNYNSNECAFRITSYKSNDSNSRIAAESLEQNNNNNNNNTSSSNSNSITFCGAEMDKSINSNNNSNNNQSNNSAIIRPTSDRETDSPPIYRTEDQENAFRRIEDVHNYAKLTRDSDRYSNGSSNSSSSIRGEEEEEDEYIDDDVDEENDEGDYDDDEHDADVGKAAPNVAMIHANFYRKRVQSDGAIAKLRSQAQLLGSGAAVGGAGSSGGGGGGSGGGSGGGGGVTGIRAADAVKRSAPQRSAQPLGEMEADAETETHDVDVVTVESGGRAAEQGGAANATPDHHARRPMNAFLIFCKRHRAIVKERYKTFENRAITKILGEWWASLEANDKTYFTNLAQQNKDAFFSANPNFQWYKLPAPPLRTLSTRTPTVSGAAHDADDDLASPVHAAPPAAPPLQFTGARARAGHYFKLADEAQMGELSTLMTGGGGGGGGGGGRVVTGHGNDHGRQECALQHALGETTKFINVHMPSAQAIPTGGAAAAAAAAKRRMHSGNSLSSNSSEDDAVPKKSARTCKGKIYQELMNSGQIAAITKKMKAVKGYGGAAAPHTEHNGYARPVASAVCAGSHPLYAATSAAGKRTVSESEGMQHHYALAHFDLEEKIKELPALSLDAYLQRKRNTKKKKKFTAKKRNANSVSSPTTGGRYTSNANALHSPPITPPKEYREQPAMSQQAAVAVAVGSQKRKARKESITRRDVSAIENEIASLIPLSGEFANINGRYYFNDESSSQSPSPQSPPAAARGGVSARGGGLGENTLSTSDLLILAEVAANRTELNN